MSEREPYPGLRPFLRDEIEIFFGRERQIDTMLEQLRAHRFLAVTGTSGSGKSSLVRTGLLSALEAGFLDAAGGRWRIVDIRPGSKPFSALVPELLKALDLPATPADQQLTRAALERGPLSIVEFLKRLPGDRRDSLLIVVDQFEELFRFSGRVMRDEIEAFVGLLIGSVSQTKVSIYIVLTMRSDFLGDCARFEGLPELINRSQYLTPRMTREEYRHAIEDPARVFGGRVAPSVTSRLLNDMVNVPDQLCLIQHALLMMWQHAKRRGSLEIAVEDYAAIGGLGEAISRHADHVLDAIELPPADPPAPGAQAEDVKPSDKLVIAERLFRRLTEAGGREGDVRRPTTFADLLEITGAREVDLRAVIDKFRAPGNNFLMPPPHQPIDAETTIDISHESLIRQWKKLRAWTDRESESASTYRRLEQQAILWRQGKAGLWASPDLERAMIWRSEQRPSVAWARQYGREFDTALQFLDASRSASRRAGRRRGAVIAAAVFIPIAIGVLSYWGWAADKQRKALAVLQGQTEVARKRAEEQSKDLAALQKLTSAAHERAEAWKRGALKAQLNAVLASAEAAVGKGEHARARGLVLAASDLMTTADPTGEWKKDSDNRLRYMNALISTLGTDASEIHVGDGRLQGEKNVQGAFSADSRIFAWATPSQVQFNDVKTGAVIKRHPLDGDRIHNFRLASDGRLAAFLSDRQVELFDIDSGRRRKLRDDVPLGAAALAETSDGMVLAAVTATGEFRAWTLKDNDAAPAILQGRRESDSDNAEAVAIDCEKSRCITFDGVRLRLFELDGTAREIASGRVEDSSPAKQGDAKLVLMNDLVLLGAGTKWESYRIDESADGERITSEERPDWLGREFTVLSRGGSESLLGIAMVDERLQLTGIRPELDDPEMPIRPVDARNVVALAPDGLSSVVRENDDGALKLVQFAARMHPCTGTCKGLATSASGGVYLFSDRTVLQYNPAMKVFEPFVDDVIEAIEKSLKLGSADDDDGDESKVELLGAAADPGGQRMHLLIATRESPRPQYRVVDLDLKTRKIAGESGSQRSLSGDAQADSAVRPPREPAAETPKKGSGIAKVLVQQFQQRRTWPRVAVNPWDGDASAPSFLISPAIGSIPEVRAETAPGTRVRISGDAVLAFNRQDGLLEVVRAGNALPPSKWSLGGREIVDADFLADDQIYAAYSEGSIEILQASQPRESVAARLKAGDNLVGAQWSASHREFHVLSRPADASTTTVGLFDAAGALQHSHQQIGTVVAVRNIGADTILVVGADGYTIMPVVRRSSDPSTELYARATTERWLLRGDLVKSGLTVLDGPTHMQPDAIMLECTPQVADSNFWKRRRPGEGEAYAAACSELYRMRAGSGFKAWVASLLTARYLTGDSDSRQSSLLAYQLARFARGDHVAALYLFRQLGTGTERAACASPKIANLPSAALLEGGIVASEYLSCLAQGEARLPDGIEARLPSLVQDGDPIAHALSALLLERNGDTSTDALAHSYAASLIFHELRRLLAEYELAEISNAWQAAEEAVNRQRAALASTLPQERVLEALAKAQRWIDPLQAAAGPSPARARFAAQTASAAVAAVQTDLAEGIAAGLARLETRTGITKRQSVGLALEAYYQLSKQHLDAGADDERVRPLFMSILGAAADAGDREPAIARLSNVALRYFTSGATLTPDDHEVLRGLAHEAVDDLTSAASPTGLSDEQKRRAIDTFAAGIPASDRKSLIELALLALAEAERAARDKSGWGEIIERQRRAYELLRPETDMAAFTDLTRALRWKYLQIAPELLRTVRAQGAGAKLTPEQVAQARTAVAEGLRLHVMVEPLLGDDINRLGRLASGLNYAGRIAYQDRRLEDALAHYGDYLRVRTRTVALNPNDGDAWFGLGTAQGNLSNTFRRRAEIAQPGGKAAEYVEKALAYRKESVASYRTARSKGKKSSTRRLLEGLNFLATINSSLGRIDEAFVATFDIFRLLAEDGVSDADKDWGRTRTWLMANSLARLNREVHRGPEPAPPLNGCDEQAGAPLDPLQPGPGIDFEKIDADRAIEACERALEEQKNPRFVFQRARALMKKAGDGGDSEQIRAAGLDGYRAAAGAGYPMAFEGLASAYQSRWTTKEQRSESRDLYLEFFNRTVECCGLDVARHLLGRLDGPNREALGHGALDVLAWAAELGDSAAHEEVARVLADGSLARLKPDWSGLTPQDRSALRIMHLLVASKLYEKGGRPPDAERVKALAGAAESGVSPQQVEEARKRASSWTPKTSRDAPPWLVPEAKRKPDE